MVCCEHNLAISEAPKYTKTNFVRGYASAPDSAGGTYSALQTPVAGGAPKSPSCPAIGPLSLGLQPFEPCLRDP